MNIYGLTKTTLLDYPGHVASVVFTGRCNFLCPFCHNTDLVLNPDSFPLIDEEEVLSHLKKRKNVLSGICVTGGEPTLQIDLRAFLEKVRELEYLIKLDTNGYNPDIIEELLSAGLIDYIAMDIKSGWDKYPLVSGVREIDMSRIEQSISLISSICPDYEFRTTAVKGIHTMDDFVDIAHRIPGDCHYYIQNFKENDCIPDKSLTSFTKEELDLFADAIRPLVSQVSIRGVD